MEKDYKHISASEFLKLEPGDKLLVNRDLQYIEDTYGVPYGIVDDMEELEGEIVTVDELRNVFDESEGPCVFIKEDRGHYSWAPECFECKVERSFPDKPKVIASPKGEPLGLSWKKIPTPKKGSKALAKLIDTLSEKWDSLSHKERKEIAEFIARKSTVCLEVLDNTAKIATYDFSYSPDGKVVCRDIATKETATARCHEEDIFSVEVGQLVSFAHMLGFDVDHCGSNDRFTLVRKKPAYHYGEKVLVDTGHPDCTKYMKENYKDQPGIILSSELDKKSNTYMYKVIFKDEQIFKLQESILKDLPLNFIPGAMDLKETLITIKKK